MDDANDNVWFDGPVADAVAQVNARNCIFVVYVYDDTENSKKLDDTLTNETVIENLRSKTVALRMHANSDNAALFKQLYPIYHVPILYFIRQGIVKDFGAENITREEIVAKIEQHSGTTLQQPQSASQQQQQQPSPPTPATNIGLYEPLAPTQAHNSPALAGPSPDDTDAKKERLRKQIEEARKKREEEEKKKARENEIKRREEGKTMQQTKQELEMKQNKLYFEKLKKEKKEEEEHRRKIREQIARDRAEQMAARQAEKQRKAAGIEVENESGSKRASKQYDSSSISIRQLDGSTMRNKFKDTDTLASVKEWVDQNRTDGDQPYKLLAQFPTRQFSIGDEARTLRELDLCPSATLIMKGIKNVSNAYGASASYGIMDYVYSAGGVLYSAASTVGSNVSGVMHSLFPADPTSSGSTPQPPSPGSFPATSSSPASSSQPTNAGQRLGGGSPVSRPRSNISTIHSNSAFDDNDNAGRYNGNSLNQE